MTQVLNAASAISHGSRTESSSIYFLCCVSDTELVRLLASVCMQVDKDKSKHSGRAFMTRSKSRQSLSSVPVPPDEKGGLKVQSFIVMIHFLYHETNTWLHPFQSWWNRMSNRFRRLKLTHTLRHGLSSSRLAPFPDDTETPLDATMKASVKPAVVANGSPIPASAGKGKDTGEPQGWRCHSYSSLRSVTCSGGRVEMCIFLLTGVCRASSEKDDFLITTMVRSIIRLCQCLDVLKKNPFYLKE